MPLNAPVSKGETRLLRARGKGPTTCAARASPEASALRASYRSSSRAHGLPALPLHQRERALDVHDRDDLPPVLVDRGPWIFLVQSGGGALDETGSCMHGLTRHRVMNRRCCRRIDDR